MSKLKELAEEFQTVFSGGNIPILDVVLPPLIFTLLNGRFSFTTALLAAVVISVLLIIYRVYRKQNLGYILGGIGVTILAGVLAWVSQSAKSFFLPGVITSGLTFLLTLVSLIIKRPLAAWSSHLTRGWNLEWYWHQRVRPAYSEVTWAWMVFFGAQFGIQLWLYLDSSAQSLGIVQVLTGWPALLIVLAASYLYGQRRLKQLEGPGVEEFTVQKPPPWEGQQRGF